MTDQDFSERFFVRNPTDQALRARLTLTAPKEWFVELNKLGFDKPFELKPREEVLVAVKIATPGLGQKGEVTITQEQVQAERTRVMGGLTLRLQPMALPFPPGAAGQVTPYLIGTWDLRQARTLLHVFNPTARHLRVLVVFFDDNEKPLRCVREKLSPNDLLELDLLKLELKARFGVVKVVSLNRERDVPEVGILGNQRIFFRPQGATETGLHPVPFEILREDLEYIWHACK